LFLEYQAKFESLGQKHVVDTSVPSP